MDSKIFSNTTTMNDDVMITQRATALTNSVTKFILDFIVDIINLDVFLCHKRLGHASTNILKRILSIDSSISLNV